MFCVDQVGNTFVSLGQPQIGSAPFRFSRWDAAYMKYFLSIYPSFLDPFVTIL